MFENSILVNTGQFARLVLALLVVVFGGATVVVGLLVQADAWADYAPLVVLAGIAVVVPP